MSHDARVIPAESHEEAQVIAAVLRGAEIPVYVGGEFLMDEFSIPASMLGMVGSAVVVPGDRYDEAQAVLKKARDSGDA